MNVTEIFVSVIKTFIIIEGSKQKSNFTTTHFHNKQKYAISYFSIFQIIKKAINVVKTSAYKCAP